MQGSYITALGSKGCSCTCVGFMHQVSCGASRLAADIVDAPFVPAAADASRPAATPNPTQQGNSYQQQGAPNTHTAWGVLQGHTHRELLCVGVPRDLVAGGLIEVVELIGRLQLPARALLRAGPITDLQHRQQQALPISCCARGVCLPVGCYLEVAVCLQRCGCHKVAKHSVPRCNACVVFSNCGALAAGCGHHHPATNHPTLI